MDDGQAKQVFECTFVFCWLVSFSLRNKNSLSSYSSCEFYYRLEERKIWTVFIGGTLSGTCGGRFSCGSGGLAYHFALKTFTAIHSRIFFAQSPTTKMNVLSMNRRSTWPKRDARLVANLTERLLCFIFSPPCLWWVTNEAVLCKQCIDVPTSGNNCGWVLIKASCATFSTTTESRASLPLVSV